MQIHLTIHYATHYPGLGHNSGLQRGNYEVDSMEYEIDPDKEAARVAKRACDKLIRDNVNKVTLRKIIYNETNDITDKVRELYIGRK
ncbi:hypothetical protein P4571_06765 [Niallia alba]|uniref:hypothetical protein n=1 Tax=Niallia alba TaxID=2729105 RepID=UPI002E243C62|nr:hypothetical protein [Niallia alba]